MDFTVYEVIAQVGAVFSGGNAVFEMGWWTVAGVVHFERFEYVLFDEVSPDDVRRWFRGFYPG